MYKRNAASERTGVKSESEQRSKNSEALIYDARGNGDGGVSPTITGDHQNRITDYTAIVLKYEKTVQSSNKERMAGR